MPVIALEPNYHGPVADRVENFHGLQLLYIGWDRHLSYCSPLCIPVAPELSFAQLLQLLPTLYTADPDHAALQAGPLRWLLNGLPFTPDPQRGLAAQGIGHKALLRFATPSPANAADARA